ncbi:MAG: sterol desaturase family protein [Phenylobacterium sp.]|nr:sterol desaturase family protein [Phenylobacterium sp.]
MTTEAAAPFHAPQIRTDTWPPGGIYWGLQPALLVFVYCAATGLAGPIGTIGGLLIAFVVLSIVEEVWPARRDWKQTARERVACIAMFALSVAAMSLWQWIYPALLHDAFAPTRAWFGPLWPSFLPMPLQVLAAFLALQFFAYWLHRGQHQVGLLWRATGHGVHHTYTRLNAINWNANHPLEAVSLILPAAILYSVFGVGQAAEAAAALAILSAACAHMNIRVNIRGIGLIFTANVHHVHHHSSDFRESNTNYGCASTLWDRVFGTFEHADTASLGDLPREPGLLRKLIMPIVGRG